jgi:hypothetical protein
MAARRLLIVLLVVISVSTLAAALAPRPEPDRNRTQTSDRIAPGKGGPERAEPARPPGKAFEAIVIDDGKGGSVRLQVGDQLTLTVRSRKTDQVEIRGLGALEPVAPEAPARFDLIADRPGRFPIRLADANRHLATIIIAKRKRGRGP